MYQTDAEGKPTELIAAGYQRFRPQQIELPTGQIYRWRERLLVVRSLADANKQFAALQRRIEKATQALWELTPQPGRGRRQIRSKAELIGKADAILTEHQVTGHLQYTFVKQQQVKVRYIGKGRGGPKRKKQQTRVTRYQMTAVIPNHVAINDAFARMGFKVYATNQSEGNLPLDEAVILYRAAPRIERHFHLFKSKPIGIQPMYVRDDDQIKGLIRLLSLCVRLLTLMEIVSRRHLAVLGEPLAGVYEGQPSRTTLNPTAKKLLGAFRGIHRVRATPSENSTLYTTPLRPLQQQILAMLSIDATIYQMPTHKLNTLNVIGQRCGQVLAHIVHTFKRVANAP